MHHVFVSRDLDDPRAVLVPVDQLRNPHVATDCGGRMTRIEETLAVYMHCDLIAGRPFGHECKHRSDGRPCSIKVMVREDLSAPESCVLLRVQARRFKPSPRRPAKVAGTLALSASQSPL